MRRPKPPETPIDAKRIKVWTNEFGAYRHAVTRASIEDWLNQFDNKDKDVAARVLDAVDFYGNERIASSYRNALTSLDGWHPDPARRTGKWWFAPFSGSAGESGDSMLHQFRLANGMTTKKYNDLFIYKSELMGKKLSHEDTVVLVDDMTATGEQVCTVWKEHFEELVTGAGRTFLIVVVAGPGAVKRISQETELSLVPANQLSTRDEFFSLECGHFSTADKTCIKKYSKIASSVRPEGFGNCGYLLVFQHRCPNNTIPILHNTNNRWNGLFPRHD